MNDLLFLLQRLLLAGLFAWTVYTLLSLLAVWQWKRGTRQPAAEKLPSFTLLKPVCGVDAEVEANFRSFCEQDYPADKLQLLFCALDTEDPALITARRMQREYPHLDIEVLSAPPHFSPAPNRKVSNLLLMYPRAKHSLLVLSDSDMRVPANYLRYLAAPFCDSNAKVGLVTCPYRGFLTQSMAAQFEAVGIGADFIPGALLSRMLEGVGFAFGATIAVSREALQAMGGLEPLQNELADDYLLGSGVRKAGYEVEISACMVEDVMGRESAASMWKRRLRWARTVRASRPGGYAGMAVTHGLPIALLYAVCHGPYAAWVVAVLLLMRFAAVFCTSWLTGDSNPRRYCYLLPLSDLLSFVLYVASFLSNTIEWRGRKYRVERGGRLRPG